jgi:hypothetical protein
MYFPKSLIISLSLAIFSLGLSKLLDNSKFHPNGTSRIKIRPILFNCALILSGITLSLTRSVEQDSVLSGIVYGGYVVFPEDNLAHSSLTLPTLPTVISSLWLNNSAAVGIMNYLLTLTGFLIFLYAYFLILRSFLNPHPQLILVALVLTIWNPVYDYFSTSYPAVLPGTTTTFGLLGIGLAFLTFSNLLASNFRSAGIYIGLLLATHLTYFVMAMFFAALYLMIQVFFSKDYRSINRFLIGLFPTFLVSVPLYYNSLPNIQDTAISTSEMTLLKAYLGNLDVHRNPDFNFPRSIPGVITILIVLTLVILVHRNFQGISNRERGILVFLLGFSGVTLISYLAQIMSIKSLSTGFFNIYMLWRITNLFGLLLSPLLIVALVRVIVHTLEKVHFNFGSSHSLSRLSKIITIIGFLFLIRTELMGGLDALNGPKHESYGNQKTNNCLSNSKLKVALTAPSLSRAILVNCRQPILLASALDNIPYENSKINLYNEVLSNVFNIDMTNPPNVLLHTATLSDENLEALWVNRTRQNWKYLAHRFEFQEVIVPQTWENLALCKVKNSSTQTVFVRYSTNSAC